jgi:hypothetical protein
MTVLMTEYEWVLSHNYSIQFIKLEKRNKTQIGKLKLLIYFDIDIDIFVNCNWVDTRWQYTFTHKQYIEHHN